MNTKTGGIGVIVARFQVPELHAGHRYLIDHVRERHEDVLVVLGTPEFPTPRNPLSYEMRKHMVDHIYRGIHFEKIFDHPSNEVWSKNLDRLIKGYADGKDVVLYASRDSFFSVYSGEHKTRLVPELEGVSGTNCRKHLIEKYPNSDDFRKGVIYAWETRLAVTRPMVDVAVLRRNTSKVLLAGKKTDPADKWRFIGGLVDQTDPSLEYAAKRETIEETSHIEVDNLRYVGSSKVGDWRYNDSGEAGITTLFTAEYIFGIPRARDDIMRLAWFPYNKINDVLVESHEVLGEMLIKHLSKT